MQLSRDWRNWLTVIALVVFLVGCGGEAALAPVGKPHVRKKGPIPSIYVVKPGDTLYSIAFIHGKDYRQVARLNGIRSPYLISIGQKIRLLPRKSRKSAVKAASKNKIAAKGKTVTQTRKVKKQSKRTKSSKNPKKSIKNSTKSLKTSGPVKWKWPTQGRILSTFSNKSSTRKGLDISGRAGQAVQAAAGGKIVYSGSGLRGYGKLIIVKHNERYLSAYAHNRKLLVKEGQQVKQGQTIAEMGRSGTDRIKLHFEIRLDGNPVDPIRYLPKK